MRFTGSMLLGVAILTGVGGSLSGCATHGEVESLRNELRRDLAATRAFLNERIDQSSKDVTENRQRLAEEQQQMLANVQGQIGAARKKLEEEQRQALAGIQKHLEGAAPLQVQLKEMQNHQARLQKSVDELSQQLGGLKASHTSLKEIQAQLDAAKHALAEIRAKHDALRRDEARITAAMQVYEQTLLKTLKSEQSGSRDRLKTLETAVKDLEQVNVNAAPASHR